MASEGFKAGSSGSLSDRISAPLNAASTAFSPAAASTTPGPSKSTGSWADEVASPVTSPVNESSSSLTKAQMDGSTIKSGGSALQDVEQYEVEVKLSDIQGDEKSPLYSVKSFDQLGM